MTGRFQRGRGLQGDQQRNGDVSALSGPPCVKGVDNRAGPSFTLYIWQFYAPFHPVHLPPVLGRRTQFIAHKFSHPQSGREEGRGAKF